MLFPVFFPLPPFFLLVQFAQLSSLPFPYRECSLLPIFQVYTVATIVLIFNEAGLCRKGFRL